MHALYAVPNRCPLTVTSGGGGLGNCRGSFRKRSGDILLLGGRTHHFFFLRAPFPTLEHVSLGADERGGDRRYSAGPGRHRARPQAHRAILHPQSYPFRGAGIT